MDQQFIKTYNCIYYFFYFGGGGGPEMLYKLGVRVNGSRSCVKNIEMKLKLLA